MPVAGATRTSAGCSHGRAIDDFGAPELCAPEELADDARVLTIAMLGAPTIMLEKGLAGEEVDRAIRSLEQHLGEQAAYLMPLEIGGINSLVPIMAAARLGLPLVDGDGMGRAFPELQTTTFNAHGVGTTPLALTDDHGTSLLLEAPDAASAEGMIRTVSVALGCSAVLCSYPMTGRQVRECAVHGTLSLARDVGRTIEAGARSADPVASLIEHLRGTRYYAQCRLLFDGRVIDVRREVEGGFSVGHLRLAHLGGSGPVAGHPVPERVPVRAGGWSPQGHRSGPGLAWSSGRRPNRCRPTPCDTGSG